MRGRLRENEQTLSEFHKKALEQANSNLLRNEEIRKKYENVLDENKVKFIIPLLILNALMFISFWALNLKMKVLYF